METKRTILALALCAALATLCVPAQSKTLYVDDDASAGGDGASWTTAYTFLQDALSEAETAGEPVEIRIAQGIYRPDRDAANPAGTGYRGASFELTSNLTLAGDYAGAGAADPNARDIEAYETILSGDLAGDDVPVADPCDLMYASSRAENSYNILTNERDASTIRLHGLTVSGGYANGRVFDLVPPTAGGGGFRASYVTGLVIACCVFEGNAGSWGAGAVELTHCTDATIAESRFIGNMSVMSGGGIVIANNSSATLIDCEISGNYVRTWGGGLYTKSSDIVVSRCVLQGNVTSSYGGGAYVEGGNPAFVDCFFAENSANYGGGAGSAFGMSMFRGCRFCQNKASATGGGIYVGNTGSASLKNCLLHGNQAEEGGGLSTGSYEVLVVEATTFHDNQALRGGQFACPKTKRSYLGAAEIASSTLSPVENSLYTEDSSVSITYSCVAGGLDSIIDPNGNVTWGPGNLEIDPCFVDPGYWDDSGTPEDPNDDFFVEGDYHLKSQAGRWDPVGASWVQDDVTSPCIDAGDPNSPIGYEPFPNGGVINLGAYGGTAEASKSYFDQALCQTPIAGDINGDCRVDLKDVAILLSHWLQTGTTAEE